MKPVREIYQEEKHITVDGFNIPSLIAALGRMNDVVESKDYHLYADSGCIIISINVTESDQSYNKRVEQWKQEEDKRLKKLEREVLKQKKNRKKLYEELKQEFE